MNCPVCPGSELKMTDRGGVEIDYCPKCRGVWLDRGELDKIIERASADAPAGPGPARAVDRPMPPGPMPVQPQAYPPGYNPNQDSKYGHQHKKKSVWRDMFDF